MNEDNFVALSYYFTCPIVPILKVKPRPRPSSSSSQAMVLSVVVTITGVLLLLLSSCHAACNQDDRDSLLSFSSYVTPLSSPLNWSSSIDCCLWEGVDCRGTDGRVTHLILPSRNLNGTLSSSLSNLTSLSHLNLSHNRLSGPLPTGFFSSLQVLDLSYNRLYGQLPSFDPVPIPIQVLNLSSNRFEGPLIPSRTFLGAARNLSVLNISGNILTGPIPSNICLVTSPSITLLDLSYNNFNGSIPSGLGTCSKLQIFRGGFNNLSGLIPDDVYQAVSLQQMSLPLNSLSGNISDALVNLNNLRILELFSNQLSGPIPRDIGSSPIWKTCSFTSTTSQVLSLHLS